MSETVRSVESGTSCASRATRRPGCRQIAPLSLLPGPLAALAYALPFGYMLWAPSEILRGGSSFEQAMLILVRQTVWLAASWVAFVLIWRMGLRQFSAVGA